MRIVFAALLVIILVASTEGASKLQYFNVLASPSDSTITLAQLRAIMPQLSASLASQHITNLNIAMTEGAINTCPRKAAFLAQLAHESGQLRYFQELASGTKYEGRRDLGNTQRGDGVKFKGRGPIQITGRTNYANCGRALGVDLINNPTLLATSQYGFRSAIWFWNTRRLSTYADQNTSAAFTTITRRINGGTNGAADRVMFWRRARSVLKC